MPGATFVIAYAKGSEINLDYYINKHMPVAWEAWKALATGWRLSTPDPSSESPYEAILFLEFGSAEDLGKTLAGIPQETMKYLQDDLPKYSKKPPVHWTQAVAAGTL